MPDTAAVLFTLDELWLLQRCIRHEIAGQKFWSFPPAGVELNDAIAEAIHFCTTENAPEAALRLSRGDLFAIDATVPADAKDVSGKPIGKTVLLKSYAARAELRGGVPLAECPAEPCTGAEARARLREWDDGERDSVAG